MPSPTAQASPSIHMSPLGAAAMPHKYSAFAATGLGNSLQLRPFQWRSCALKWLESLLTAQTSSFEITVAPSREFQRVLGKSGLGVTSHPLPRQCAASVPSAPLGFFSMLPTAHTFP